MQRVKSGHPEDAITSDFEPVITGHDKVSLQELDSIKTLRPRRSWPFRCTVGCGWTRPRCGRCWRR
jgi:hypothetical protein